MLRHRADWQTVLYIVAASGLLVTHWHAERFSGWLFVGQLAPAFAISIMHHNHRHLPMWRNRTLNRATDLWYTVFQGHPGFVFDLCHNNNHHRYCNTRNDWTRTYRHRDDNSLWGLTIHPVESALTLAPVVRGHLRALRQYDQVRYRGALAAYGWLFAWIGCALAIDWQKALLYVLVPQLFALYWLLGANYLQHAHTNELERFAASRNFLGLINPLCFNIGLHTAHHMQGTLHWSKLPQLHDQIRPQIHPALIEPSLLWYCVRVYILAIVCPGFKSRSLRPGPGTS